MPFENVQALLGKKPIFGICLGHQIMGLALGGKTYKLKFGHHGGNQPVLNIERNKVEITAQNHGFAVDPDSLPNDIRVTHLNLNVPVKDFPNAVSLSMLMFHIGLITGPPLAGFLLASHGPAMVYAINAVSFVAVIMGLLLMHTSGKQEKTDTKNQTRSACRHCWRVYASSGARRLSCKR